MIVSLGMRRLPLTSMSSIIWPVWAKAWDATGKPDATQKISLLNNLSQAAQGKKASADSVKQLAADGVVILDDPMLFVVRTKVADAALARKLPLACPFREMAQAGCLFSYSASLRERFERSAVYVDKILRGANPAELPFEQPAKFEFVINLITAKALDIKIPNFLSATADAVIE